MTGKRAIDAAFCIACVFGLAGGPVHAVVQSRLAAVEGVRVEATATPVRWLGLIPTRTARFELTIYVDRSVRSFSAIHHECLFVDSDGREIGLASRGITAREAFTTMEDGGLASQAHEEFADRGPINVRCRATKLEK